MKAEYDKSRCKRRTTTTADFILDLEPWETDDFDYTPYLEKLKSLGFKGTSKYKTDLDDEKWMKRK